jgi:gamma-glutamylcyclotransferase (GGCT)/AIG2-like uncharacterized protein YtfP
MRESLIMFLYKALRKYRERNFNFFVLEEVKDREKLTEAERKWYDLFQPEYNMIVPREAHKTRSKKVYKIDKKTLEILDTYESASEAARQHGLDISSVCSVAKGRKWSVGGFYWKYVDEYDPNWVPPKDTRGEKLKKKVLQIDKHTLQTLKVYESASEAARETNTHVSAILAVCNGRGLTAGGYIWTFIP